MLRGDLGIKAVEMYLVFQQRAVLFLLCPASVLRCYIPAGFSCSNTAHPKRWMTCSACHHVRQRSVSEALLWLSWTGAPRFDPTDARSTCSFPQQSLSYFWSPGPAPYSYEDEGRPARGAKAAIPPPMYEDSDRPRSPPAPTSSFLANMGWVLHPSPSASPLQLFVAE